VETSTGRFHSAKLPLVVIELSFLSVNIEKGVIMRLIFLITFLLVMNMCFAEYIYVPNDYASIQEAINVSVDNDTIIVSPGTYYENIDYSGKNIMIASQFLLYEEPSYIDNTIIDGGQIASVVTVENGEGPGAAIEGFTIQSGNAEDGSGILCNGVFFSISNVYFTDNHSDDDGGGLYATLSDVNVSNCRFENNSAQDDGGGMCSYEASIQVSNCIFDNNSAQQCGGGLEGSPSSNVHITDCEFSNNFAGYNGGGIRSYQSETIISDCIFQNNQASDNGGGIFLWYSDSSVLSSVFYENISYGGMSAIDVWSGTATIQDCSISQNQSPNWGTVGFWDYASVDIVNTIVSNNQGYAFYGHSNSTTHISYCDIYSNTFGTFGGYFDQDNLGVIQELNYNEDPCDPYFNLYLDPGYTDPENFDFNLLESSVCIDSGSPYSPVDPDGTIADMGAFFYNQASPEADFAADVQEGVIPFTVNFTDLSVEGLTGNPIIEWYWDFDGDGNTDSIEQNPSFSYLNSGIYSITLTVSDGMFSDSKTKTDYIEIYDPVVADFYAVPVNGLTPLEVYFFDLSENLAVSWEWDFNNDEIIDSYEQYPVFTYPVPGIYSVSLTVSDGVYTDQEIKIDYITVIQALAVDFEADPTEGVVPLTVQFTDLSLGDPAFWLWDFNNDGFADSNEQNPSYTYTEAGSYSVKLTVSNGSETEMLTRFNYIQVDPTDADTDIIPLETKLVGCFPNPFNPSTTIRYDLKEPAFIEIQILNNKGQMVKDLVEEDQPAGQYSIRWSGRDEYGNKVSSGVYFYKMNVNGKVLPVKKGILLK
jgi:PKD repeat protein